MKLNCTLAWSTYFIKLNLIGLIALNFKSQIQVQSLLQTESLRYSSAVAVLLAVVFVVISFVMAIYALFQGRTQNPRLFPDLDGHSSFFNLFTAVPVIVTAFTFHFNGEWKQLTLVKTGNNPCTKLPFFVCSSSNQFRTRQTIKNGKSNKNFSHIMHYNLLLRWPVWVPFVRGIHCNRHTSKLRQVFREPLAQRYGTIELCSSPGASLPFA